MDKVALFFTAACNAAGISLSPHLLNRKPIATSSSAKKSVKQRRSGADDGDSDDVPPPPPPPLMAQTLAQQVLAALDMERMDASEVEAVWTLLKYLRKEGK